MKRTAPPIKVVDETAYVRCVSGQGTIREEVWQDAHGHMVRYNLAFINPHLFPRDNGRVLGYDNGHGGHHRHCLGVVTPYPFTGYEALLTRFLQEVEEFRKQ